MPETVRDTNKSRAMTLDDLEQRKEVLLIVYYDVWAATYISKANHAEITIH